MELFFFFSSRRRHTRFDCDWSSDVCSSDLDYTKNPGLSEGVFRKALGKEIFGERANERQVNDLLFLQECWFNGADWFTPALFLRPMELKRCAEREKWSGEKIQSYLVRDVLL